MKHEHKESTNTMAAQWETHLSQFTLRECAVLALYHLAMIRLQEGWRPLLKIVFESCFTYNKKKINSLLNVERCRGGVVFPYFTIKLIFSNSFTTVEVLVTHLDDMIHTDGFTSVNMTKFSGDYRNSLRSETNRNTLLQPGKEQGITPGCGKS